MPIPIGKDIAKRKCSHFFSLWSCHKPAPVHGMEAVAGFLYGLDFPHLIILCGLLCLLHHAAGVDVGHGGLYAPVPHLPLHHRKLLSLLDSTCSVGMAVVMGSRSRGASPQVSWAFAASSFMRFCMALAVVFVWIPSMVVVGPDGQVKLSTVLTYKVDKYLKELTTGKYAGPGKSETVFIDGDHGRLKALIQKPELQQGEQCPMVVFCHGFNGSKDGPMFELMADTLQAHGIASIRFDFNGHGESEGEFKDMTVPNEIEDAKKVVAYVRDLRYVSSLAVVGHSQGGVVASMTAGQLSEELGEPAFQAVALMAPAAVLRDDAIRGSVMGAQFDPFDPGEYVDLWSNLKLGAKYIRTAFSLPIYETAEKYQGPALIIHGNGDRVVPYTYGERFHQIWPKSEFLILEYFDHVFTQNIYRTTDIVSDYLIKQLMQ